VNTSLHERNHFLNLKHSEFEERINAEETKTDELNNKMDDLDYELTKSKMRNGKLESTLGETQVRMVLLRGFVGVAFNLSLPPRKS
jgi:predicted RNase H-like nuclease (RuvC/YqgF family)